jgi:membrane-associated PAP2 superfamily phosphatase
MAFCRFQGLARVEFGIAQQLRGAHFLSHDLWSFGVCWIVAQVVDLLMLQPIRTQQSNTTKH